MKPQIERKLGTYIGKQVKAEYAHQAKVYRDDFDIMNPEIVKRSALNLPETHDLYVYFANAVGRDTIEKTNVDGLAFEILARFVHGFMLYKFDPDSILLPKYRIKGILAYAGLQPLAARIQAEALREGRRVKYSQSNYFRKAAARITGEQYAPDAATFNLETWGFEEVNEMTLTKRPRKRAKYFESKNEGLAHARQKYSDVFNDQTKCVLITNQSNAKGEPNTYVLTQLYDQVIDDFIERVVERYKPSPTKPTITQLCPGILRKVVYSI